MVEFIEVPGFTARVHHYLDDAEYAGLQALLAMRPQAGDVIPGSGGLRKLRWRRKGKGKRGRVRIIYYWRSRAGEIWLLAIYAKSEETDIPPEVLRRIRKELER